jgi:diguanylate cyclase (GGDEF)-like protein/PAS domain S-box-containing protein
VYRVVELGLDRLDWRVVLFAALIAVAGAFTAMQAHGLSSERKGKFRAFWLVVAGTCAGASIWATHFLAVRSFEWGIPLGFSPVGVGASLVVAASVATAGFAFAGRGVESLEAAAGGALLGVAVVLTHFVGLIALAASGVLVRSPWFVVPANLVAVAICGAALVASRELKGRTALPAAALLMALAICGLPFVSVAAIAIAPDATIMVPRSYLNGSTLAIVVGCVTAFTMIVARVATIVSSQSVGDTARELQSQHALLQQREEELRRQNFWFEMALDSMPHGLCMVDSERKMVVCNKRYADIYGLPAELTRPGTPLSAVLDHRIANGIYAGGDVQAYREERLRAVTKTSVRTYRLNGGRTILVTRRPTADGGWIAIHEDITERRRLQETEREAKEIVAAVLDAMPGAIICVAPDRRVMLWSRGAEQIFGYTSAEVVGQPYALVRAEDQAEFDALFERALAGEVLRDVLVKRRRKDGALVDIRFSSAALRDQDGTIKGIVYALDNVSDSQKLDARLKEQNELLKQREEKLQAKNAQLDAALNNMSQGLAMFDSKQRLIVCNRLYAEMYGLTPDQVQPGTTVRQIFEYRMANGFYHVKETEAAAFVDSWASSFGQRSARIQELADGRIISVSRGRTADGGRVVTHDDITARQKLVAQLERQHELLKAQEEKLHERNMQLDAALNNMVQGLAMFDSEHRIVLANMRYAELYGLTPDQVKPGTHLREILGYRIANGDLVGKTSDQVMESMLSRVTRSGECQYTARLCDGRYVSVSAKPMMNGYTVTTHQDITEQRRSEAKIVHMAMHDALTGLPNRVLFNERLEQALGRVNRGEIVAIHLLDLDHFKNVNDTLGHPAGDKLLQMVTERLQTLVRGVDTIARMGGDEFAILQQAISQPADASTLARRVIEAVSQPYEIEGHQVVIGTSVGIAVGPSDGRSPDQIVRNADLALYRAKGDGRGMFCFFEAHMDAAMQERRAMEYDMRKGLACGEFELFYQPVVNLATNRISGCEALIRWHHPEKGLVPPSAFIPLAEELGFIVQLGDWAIRQACATAARWPDDVKIAVNLSPVQFRSAGLMQTVVGALAASGLAPGRLELEITETILLEDSETTLATLYQLRELGVRIAMDDFGTGYSSLSYLQSFPFDRIKIDRSFIKDIGDGVGSINIVRAVAALATGLGMETTAEGVETEQQRDTVTTEGCTEMQGFLFSKPRPAREIEELYFPQTGRQAALAGSEVAEQPAKAARAGAR